MQSPFTTLYAWPYGHKGYEGVLVPISIGGPRVSISSMTYVPLGLGECKFIQAELGLDFFPSF